MTPPRTAMGIATTSYLSVRRPKDTYEFLEYSNSLGAGGIQAPLTSLDASYLQRLRGRAESLGMYVEVMVPLPKDNSGQFERIVEAAKQVGAVGLRAGALMGRRYETFNTLEDWKKFVADSETGLERAVPVLDRQRIPLGLENHKDWTASEHVALLKRYSSEYLGACIDTGNNIALLDDPMEFVRALAPYAVTTHLKDMAAREYADGFLLSEVPFGAGMLDVKEIVSVIKAARPQARLTLEMITREPLKVPCLTPKYWVTFPDRKGSALASTLAMVRKDQREKLPTLEGLDHAAQLRYEEDNVKQSLNYARERGW